MGLDISAIVVGKNYGILSKGVKIKVEVVKVNRKAGTVDIKNAAGKVVAGVTVDKLKGLQGRPSASAAPAPKPAPAKAAPAKAAPVAAPKVANKKAGPSFADIVERARDLQNRIADMSNELADVVEALDTMEPGEPAALVKGKGKAANKPMAEEVEADEDEIDFD